MRILFNCFRDAAGPKLQPCWIHVYFAPQRHLSRNRERPSLAKHFLCIVTFKKRGRKGVDGLSFHKDLTRKLCNKTRVVFKKLYIYHEQKIGKYAQPQESWPLQSGYFANLDPAIQVQAPLWVQWFLEAQLISVYEFFLWGGECPSEWDALIFLLLHYPIDIQSYRTAPQTSPEVRLLRVPSTSILTRYYKRSLSILQNYRIQFFLGEKDWLQNWNPSVWQNSVVESICSAMA